MGYTYTRGTLCMMTQYKYVWDTHTHAIHTHVGYPLDTLSIMAYDDTIHTHMGYPLDTLSIMAYDDTIHTHMRYTCT